MNEHDIGMTEDERQVWQEFEKMMAQIEQLRRSQRRRDMAYLFALTVWAWVGTTVGLRHILDLLGVGPSVAWMISIILCAFVGYFAGQLAYMIWHEVLR